MKPSPSAQNRATLYYNCARASANMGRQLEALKSCNHALSQVPKYLSALEQRAKSQLALYNYKVRQQRYRTRGESFDDEFLASIIFFSSAANEVPFKPSPT